jgi:hypothetical protein
MESENDKNLLNAEISKLKKELNDSMVNNTIEKLSNRDDLSDKEKQ